MFAWESAPSAVNYDPSRLSNLIKINTDWTFFASWEIASLTVTVYSVPDWTGLFNRSRITRISIKVNLLSFFAPFLPRLTMKSAISFSLEMALYSVYHDLVIQNMYLLFQCIFFISGLYSDWNHCTYNTKCVIIILKHVIQFFLV